MLSVKVLGPGCANCKRLEQMVNRAISDLAITADVQKITDYGDIMRYNVISTPGLVINESVVSTGRIPSPVEVTTWLTNAVNPTLDV